MESSGIPVRDQTNSTIFVASSTGLAGSASSGAQQLSYHHIHDANSPDPRPQNRLAVDLLPDNALITNVPCRRAQQEHSGQLAVPRSSP